MNTFCNKCGKKLEQNDEFCQSCGAKIDQTETMSKNGKLMNFYVYFS
ncbi:zinc ribbon domain-containing protein [Patescibacteria group bacterium]|nr:zinc ribbon domain-containing protein [Patescibacteria group bacterium]MBU4579402.1 zinc ribbon domain-containing protein [Patescibacteria group bacterium]